VGGGPTAGRQEHLAQARQIERLSFTVHVPLVCVGIAFPASNTALAGAIPLLRSALASSSERA
jgi:hypothetical protein